MQLIPGPAGSRDLADHLLLLHEMRSTFQFKRSGSLLAIKDMGLSPPPFHPPNHPASLSPSSPFSPPSSSSFLPPFFFFFIHSSVSGATFHFRYLHIPFFCFSRAVPASHRWAAPVIASVDDNASVTAICIGIFAIWKMNFVENIRNCARAYFRTMLDIFNYV